MPLASAATWEVVPSDKATSCHDTTQLILPQRRKARRVRACGRVFVSEAKYADVIALLQQRGWRWFPHGLHFPGFALKWTNYCKINWQFVKEFQIVNHLHHAVVFCHKATFTRALQTAFGAHECAQFMPNTFEVGTDTTSSRVEMDSAATFMQLKNFHRHFVYCQALVVLKRCWQEITNAKCRSYSPQALDLAVKVALSVQHNGRFDASSSQLMHEMDVRDTTWSVLFEKPNAAQTSSSEDQEQNNKTLQQVQQLLTQLEAMDPQFHLVENHNIWIVKPANLSRGRGIHLVQSLDQILQLQSLHDVNSSRDGKVNEPQGIGCDTAPGHHADRLPPAPTEDLDTDCRWLIQKYIERPLLIGGRKFDIRQWVLITSLEPLQVRWFSRCYLRFCSKPFSLEEIEDKLIHLTNFSIQKDAVPVASDELQEQEDVVEKEEEEGRDLDAVHNRRLTAYLRWCRRRDKHGSDIWENSIVPQMQDATRRAILAVKDRLVRVGRGFEWLGLDFLLDEELHVWILEVNVSPDITHSTRVTGNLVPKATSDALDVILEDSDQQHQEEVTTARPDHENEWKPLSMELVDHSVLYR